MISGRKFYESDQVTKSTTDEYRRLDVRALHREGLLAVGSQHSWMWSRRGAVVASIEVRAEAGQLILGYSAIDGGERKHFSYPVGLSWTPCRYGGRRPWFLCPSCQRRVAILYGGTAFACRHCRQLAYESQREANHDRLARQANKIRQRLGWEPGILNGKGWKKPKGMHWRTFTRLNEEHDKLVSAVLAGISLAFGLRR